MSGDNVNVSAKWSERKMEGAGEGIRTMECLRGRLLAERAASRVAKEETEQLGKKLIELEELLKKEIKSKRRAEKRLKFLFEKLESLNISYASDESSDNSSFLEKSEISSVSSTGTASSSSTKQYQDPPETQIKCGIGEPEIKTELLQASTATSRVEGQNCPSQSHEEKLGASDEGISGNSHVSDHSSHDEDKLKRDDNRLLKAGVGKKEISGGNGNGNGNDDGVDNSIQTRHIIRVGSI